MPRHEFSARTKVLAFERANGRCEKCSARLSVGNTEYDHEIADRIGGENSLENCRVLCRTCHATKTKKDRKVIAKTERNRRKNAGIKKLSRFACGRNSRFKKKLNGEVVLRHS